MPAPTLVQSNSSGVNGVTTPSQPLAFASPNTAGNGLVIKVALNAALGATPTDSQGNAYQLAIQYSNAQIAGWTTAIYYCLSCKAGANTVTVPFSTTSGMFTIEEYSPGANSFFSGLDGTPASNNGSSVTGSCGPIVLANATDVLLGLLLTTNAPASPGSGFTQIGTIGIAAQQFGLSEYEITSAAGSFSVVALPGGNGPWLIIGVAIAAQVNPPTPPTPPLNPSPTPPTNEGQPTSMQLRTCLDILHSINPAANLKDWNNNTFSLVSIQRALTSWNSDSAKAGVAQNPPVTMYGKLIDAYVQYFPAAQQIWLVQSGKLTQLLYSVTLV